MPASFYRVWVQGRAGQAALQTVGNQKELETCRVWKKEAVSQEKQEAIRAENKPWSCCVFTVYTSVWYDYNLK